MTVDEPMRTVTSGRSGLAMMKVGSVRLAIGPAAPWPFGKPWPGRWPGPPGAPAKLLVVVSPSRREVGMAIAHPHAAVEDRHQHEHHDDRRDGSSHGRERAQATSAERVTGKGGVGEVIER